MPSKIRSSGPAARLRGLALLCALVVLLAACVPVTGPSVPVATAGPAAVTATAPAAAATAMATPGPTAAPVSPPATATAIPATAQPTGAPTAAATGQPAAGAGIVVQAPDNSIQLIDVSGKQTTLYQATGQADFASIFPPGNVAGNAVYVPLSGRQPGLVRVESSGGNVLAGIQGPFYGVAASSAGLAFGTADLNATPAVAAIMGAQADGSQVKTLVQETSATQIPHVLRVMRWSADGKRLFFGKEPLGLGGYILFGGLTNLWAYDPASGGTTELIHERAANAAICIDDLAPNEKLAADHCNPTAMEVIDLATGKASPIAPPAQVAQFGAAGGARFSPDSAQLAYALARHNPDDEQGWVAIAAAAGGASRLIATSPAQDYFSVAAWLDAQTLVLQSAGKQAPGIWTVSAQGGDLKRLADGTFVGILAGSQAQGLACGDIRLLGPNLPSAAGIAQAEDCFWQAYQARKPASLTVTIAGVDAGIVHQFSLLPESNGVRIQDSAAHYVAPRPPAAPDVVLCAGLTQQDGGLRFQGCGDQGDIVVPGVK